MFGNNQSDISPYLQGKFHVSNANFHFYVEGASVPPATLI